MMKLIDALQIARREPAPGATPLAVALVCGFSPLHLQTFLAANLRLLFPDRQVDVQTGLYGDLAGNLERLETATVDAGAVVMEWSDLDPRLGIRRLGGWGPGDLGDIVENVRAQAARFRGLLERISQGIPLAFSTPTLPLPPLSFMPGWRASAFDLALRESIASLEISVAPHLGLKMVNSQRLSLLSPPGDRFDVKSELLAGFPYTVSHADAVAWMLARLIRNPTPKKGLITDLDDTLWSGILGEVGVDRVSWDLDHRSQKHGLYQQLLRALAEEGVLIAIASKNDPGLVEEAFRTANPILPLSRVFPVEAHWGPKSESVARILAAWNVGADSVVFVDDSPMDLAEVKTAHPDVECLLFPKNDDQAAYELLERLRDLFGKDSVSQEDAIRLESIRSAHAVAEGAPADARSSDRFLEQANGELTLAFAKDPPDPRALELVNKTNQFNLNGKGYTEAAWRAHLAKPDAFLLLAAYQDKYGPLGKIAVLSGRRDGRVLWVDVWVMSCRAFSRRIEHHCLAQLFERFDAEELAFDFVATPRNGPLQDFFVQFVGGPPQPGLCISKKTFFEKCPPLFQTIEDSAHG